MGELSGLPSFGIFLAWLDSHREVSASTICTPDITEDRMRWEAGRMSLIEEIREIVIDNSISSDSYEFTGRGAPARRLGKTKEAV